MLRRALIALPLAIVTLALIDLGSWFALPCAIHPVAEGDIERNAQHNNSENACPFQGGIVAAGLIKMAQWPPEAWTAAATLILAVFTLVLAAVTREHVRLIQAEFVATHRPKLRAYAFEVEDRDLPSGKPISVLFFAQNIGETPAHLELLEGCIYVAPRKDRPLERGIPFRFKKFLKITLVGGERDLFGIEDGTAPTEANGTAIYSGDMPLFCVGRISYTDDNGIRRETGFCRQFSFRPYKSEAVTDSEYEYEY
jgi:hypothetical protein